MTNKKGMSLTESIIIGSMIGGSIMLGLILIKPLVQINNNQVQTSNKSSQSSTQSQTQSTPEKPIVSIPSPETAVINYYDFINSQQYEAGWNQLSGSLQNNRKVHPEGYKTYTDWWTKVAKVDVLDTNVVNKNSERSIVDSRLKYQIKSNGRIIYQTLRFDFIYDKSSNSWLIDGVDKLK